MEIARMDYRFTAILILMLTALAFCVGPAYSKNEYLNEYGMCVCDNCKCGSKRTYKKQIEHATDMTYENESS